MKVKRDRIFVVTLGLVLANLIYYFAGTFTCLLGNLASAWHWAVLVANGVAIYGVLFLLRSYNKGRKLDEATKDNPNTQEQETEDRKEA